MKKYLLVSLFSVTLFSCKKNENKSQEPTEKSIKAFKVENSTDTTIFKSNSILVKSDINSKFINRTDNSITFTNDESLSLVKIGDIMYSQPTSFAPNGYAYRVTGITNSGSTTSFSTEFACLEDIVLKTSQYRDYVLESDALKSQFFKTLQWLPDFNALATGVNIESTLNTTKASNYLERISKRIKSHSITATEATMQYIFFDKDGQFESTTNDQVILEFKLKYNLANTHLFFENGYFNFQGSHKWDFSAYFIWEASTTLTENDKKDFKEKLKNEILGKRFNVLSVDLLPASPTTLAFRPKLDIFYKIGFDLKGEFKIGGELTNLRYDFKVENTIGNPTNFNATGSILNKGTFTGKIEALVEFDVTLGCGLGLTCYFPALEYERGKKSYIGLYTDVTATFRPNLSNFTYNQANGKMCADIDLPYSLNWQTYLETKVGIWRNKVTLLQPNPIVLVTVPPFSGTLGTKPICIPIANIPITDGLVAYYPFNGNANDESGNNQNGTIMNTPTYNTGVSGQSVKLTGRCDYGWCEGDLGDHILIPMPQFNTMSSFSLNIWVKEESMLHPDGEAYLSFGSGHDIYIGHYANELRFASSGSSVISVPFNTTNINTFKMYTMVFENGTLKAYQNGILVGTKLNATRGFTGTVAGIARHWSGAGTYTRFSGNIDQVRVYNRSLSAAEINNLYSTQQ